MSRYKPGDVIYIWWHGIGRAYYRKGTVIEILDDVNAMIRFDGFEHACKCYIDKAIPYRTYDIMGETECNNMK